MARILGRAGSGGALRWAGAGEVRIKTTQSKTEKRIVPRRISSSPNGVAALPAAGGLRPYTIQDFGSSASQI
jgi:hypothetical protein